MHILRNRLAVVVIATAIAPLTTLLGACSGSGPSGAIAACSSPRVATASRARR